MKIKGAQALVASLEKEGVEVLFGYPGGVALPIFDALYDSKQINTVLVRHEQGAAHAADGYARATGDVGVCMATSGPGAMNLITGIANAYMDSTAMVAITAQVLTAVIGTDAFQETDTFGVTLPITKHNYLIKDVRDLPDVMKEAFHIARTGRPGPVLIDVPVDVSRGEITCAYPESVNLPGYRPTLKGHARQIKQAAHMIAHAKRPLLYVGGGCLKAEAWDDVKKLALLAKLPVTTTLMGKGSFPETHELSLGMPGMHGARYANYALTHNDLLIAIGVRFDDRVTGKLEAFAKNAKVIHIDIDPAEIGKVVQADVPIVGDAKNIVEGIIRELKKMEHKPITGPWLGKIKEWKKKYPLHYHMEGALKPEFVVEQIYDLTKDRDVVICTEVGQNQMWASQYYKITKPRSWVSSGGLGTMGFGLPASIGAQFGRPKAAVFDIAGDGSIQMVSQELATAVCNNLPINVVILNNGYLGMVRQWQELFYDHRYASSDLAVGTPDFVKLAEAYGGIGTRCTKPEEVMPALKKAIASPKVNVIDCVVEREENVYPMVAPGASIEEMLGGVPGGGLDEMLEEEGWE